MRKIPWLALIASSSLVWAYWSTLADLAARWRGDAHYSHGWLVPAFSAFLLYRRRGMLRDGPPRRPSWLGLLVLAAGLGLGLCGRRSYYQWFEEASILVAMAGLALALGGSASLRWTLPSIGFLLLMIPLPWRLEVALGDPLRQAATAMSTYVLQLLGQPAYATGNIIHLGESRIGVVDACNGLGMMMTFFTFSIALGLLSSRCSAHRIGVVISAPAIAISCNVARIAATGLLHRFASSPLADRFYHDVAGLFMMPLALAMLWGVDALLSRLLVGEPGTADGPGRGPDLSLIVRDRVETFPAAGVHDRPSRKRALHP